MGAIRRRPAKHAASLHSAARDQRRMHEIMIPALLAGNVSDGAAELTLHHNQCLVKFGSSVAARNHGEVFDEIGKTCIELAG